MRHLKSIILITTLFSCNLKQEKTKQPSFFPISLADTTLYYDFFSITVPKTWKKPNDDTLPKITDATARGRIQIGDSEFIWYQNGIGADDYSNFTLIEPIAAREKYLKDNRDTSTVLFSDNPNLKIYNIWYGQISGFKTKFFEPVKIGYGFTGLYIDSVSEIKGVAKMNFTLFGEKLDSEVNMAFVKAMKTIKYKPPPY